LILVFGAAGFIGTYLTTHLAKKGVDVIASDVSAIGEEFYRREGVRYVTIDITSRDAFVAIPEGKIDAVVHLACVQPANVSERRYDAADFIRVNVLGTLNILELCRSRGVPKLVYTCSHRNTQGMWEEKASRPISEEDGRSLKFTGDYAMFSISESAAADCIEHYAQTFGIEGTVLRLPPVYGYGPHTEIFKDGKPIKTGFQIFIERARQGAPIELWGDPENGRDIVYVKDVVAAIELALEKRGVGGLLNISSGRKLTLREQADVIVRTFSKPASPSPIVERRDIANNIENYVYDISKAKRVLGWEPKYAFEDMLRDYESEAESGRFAFLVEKRKRMLENA
jgi:UDP-glucose 4-epimerase